MQIDPLNGLLDVARQCQSPNYDDRPDNTPMDLVVIHGISLPPGEYGGPWIDALFCNQLDPDAHPYFRAIHTHKVSSHLLIRRDGEIVQYVPFHKRAWHAGVSCYKDRDACNNFSLGIELEGCDETPYEEVQYEVLAKVVKVLITSYPELSPEHIVGHNDIAPGRKTDPGPRFDWHQLRTYMASNS